MDDTTTPSIPSRYGPPAAGWRWLLCALVAGAIGVSSFLVMHAYAQSPLPGCGAATAFDCDSVLSSPWSKVFGVPVSLPAIGLYLAVLVLLQLSLGGSTSRQRWVWRVMVVLAGVILASALWFVGLQVWMGSYCLYCMIAHGLGVAIALWILLLAPIGRSRITPDEPADPIMIPAAVLMSLLLAGVLVTGVMAGLQWRFPPADEAVQITFGGQADFDTGPGPDRRMSILAGKVQLSPADFPMLGSTDSPHIVVYLYDYTCPNCRAMHHQFVQAIDKLQGQLSVVKLVVPLDHQCNPHVEKTSAMHEGACELAKLSIAVWLADRSKFQAFDAWLSEGDRPASPADARAYASGLVGEKALASALADPEVDKRIAANITLYTMTGGSVVPQFIMGRNIIFSRPDPDQLMALFKEHLGIEPPALP